MSFVVGSTTTPLASPAAIFAVVYQNWYNAIDNMALEDPDQGTFGNVVLI